MRPRSSARKPLRRLIAAVKDDRENLTYEAADVLYHLLVMLAARWCAAGGCAGGTGPAPGHVGHCREGVAGLSPRPAHPLGTSPLLHHPERRSPEQRRLHRPTWHGSLRAQDRKNTGIGSLGGLGHGRGPSNSPATMLHRRGKQAVNQSGRRSPTEGPSPKSRGISMAGQRSMTTADPGGTRRLGGRVVLPRPAASQWSWSPGTCASAASTTGPTASERRKTSTMSTPSGSEARSGTTTSPNISCPASPGLTPITR